jgi:hypothetical protein
MVLPSNPGTGDSSVILATAFTTVKVGEEEIIADAGKQTITFVPGLGINIALDETDYAINIAGAVMTGATSTKNGISGLVPAPSKDKVNSFLRGDGTWQEVLTEIGELSTQDIVSLTGYVIKGNDEEDLATTDTLNIALGKLENKADFACDFIRATTDVDNDGNNTIDRLKEIFDVLQGINETDTIQSLLNKYLLLTGGTITGNLEITGTLAVDSTSTLHNILPETTDLYSIGSTDKYWKNLYVNNIQSQLIHGNLDGNLVGGGAN